MKINEDFFKFNKNNAKDRIQLISFYKQDIIKEIKEKTLQLIYLQNEIDKRYQELYIFYLADFHIKLSTKEAKEFAEKDKDILDKKKEIKKLEVEIKELEETLKNLSDLMWSIKNYLDWLKLENGI